MWDPTGFEGQLTSATRYVGGASGSAYTTTYSLYDTLYRPNRTTVTIPVTEGALAGSYQSNTKYNLDGTTQSASYPAAGSLASEVITPTYDEVMRTKTLTGTGGATYLTDAVYSYTGKPMQYTYQATGAKKTQVTNSYQWGTQRLDNSNVTRENVAGTDKSATYGYDEAGNITSIKDVSRDGTDNQCYGYDYLARMTEAWAQQTTTCADTPSASVLGGPAPYWQSYTYNTDGSRATETLHDPTGDSAKDIKRTYSYPAPGAVRPHSLTAIDTTGPTGIATDSYTYDDAGNTHTRTIGGNTQTLDWDTEGHLVKVTADDGNGGTKTTSYVYDADGNRLISRSDSETTLYLGATQLTLANGATTAKATRYYDLGGGNQAIRTDDNKLSFLIGDHHGTSELAINAADLSEQKRRSTPSALPAAPNPPAGLARKASSEAHRTRAPASPTSAPVTTTPTPAASSPSTRSWTSRTRSRSTDTPTATAALSPTVTRRASNPATRTPAAAMTPSTPSTAISARTTRQAATEKKRARIQTALTRPRTVSPRSTGSRCRRLMKCPGTSPGARSRTRTPTVLSGG